MPRAEAVDRSNSAHAVCIACWGRLFGRLAPVRVLGPDDWERCCFCGGMAQHGLYRQSADPLDLVACAGHRRRLSA